jgi:hypothetical protein
MSRRQRVARLVLRTLLTAGLVLGTATAAFAAPAAIARAPQAVGQASRITPVYYVWNHHHYDHRSWDAAHKRWRYY